MHYHVYCKEKVISENYKAAISEFEKRLSAYCDIHIHESLTLSFPKETSKTNHHFLFLKEGPSTYSSEKFAVFLQDLQLSGKSMVHVIIGFSEEELYEALNALTDYDVPFYLSLTRCSLSVSTRTLLFYEQLYRGYTILQGKTYHK